MGKGNKKKQQTSTALPSSDGNDSDDSSRGGNSGGGNTAGLIALTKDQFTKLLQSVSKTPSGSPSTPGTTVSTADSSPTDSTMIRPKSDWISPHTKRGGILFDNAIALPHGSKPLTVNMANAEAIFARFDKLGMTHDWRHHLGIPTAGTGAVQPAVSTPGGEDTHSFDLSEMKDMLKEISKLEEEEVTTYATFYNGDLNQGLTPRADGKLITARLNLVDTDKSRRLAALEKYRLRNVSQVIWRTIESNLTMQSLETLKVEEEKFTFVCQETKSNQYDGFIALYLLLKKVKPSTVVSVDTLRKKLEQLTLKKFSYDVSLLISASQDIRQKMISEFGPQSCDDNFYLTKLMAALATGNNEPFNEEVAIQERSWTMQKPGYTEPDEIIRSLLTLYNNMMHNKTWGRSPGTGDTSKVVALTSQLDSLKQKFEAQEKQLKSLKKVNPRKPDGGDATGPWRTKYVGETTTDPKSGETMKWCKHHGKQGCYMPSDHDHAAWAAAKKEKADHRGKRDRDDKKSVKFQDAQDVPKKLRLNQKLRAALVTGAYISSSELADLEASVAEVDDADMKMSSKD